MVEHRTTSQGIAAPLARTFDGQKQPRLRGLVSWGLPRATGLENAGLVCKIRREVNRLVKQLVRASVTVEAGLVQRDGGDMRM